MPKSAEHIETSVRKLQQLGGCLRTVFAVLLVATVFFGLWVFVSIMQQIRAGAVFTSTGAVEGEGATIYILPAILWLLIALALEGIVWSVCRDMARGESPFTTKHARFIVVLGIVFLLNAVVGAFFRGNVLIEGDTLGFSYWPNATVLMIRVANYDVMLDVGSLITALVCFVFAAIWRYAALLQTQADGLV